MLLFLFFAVSAAETPAGPVPMIAISYRSVFLASFISLMLLYFIKYIYFVNTFDKIFYAIKHPFRFRSLPHGYFILNSEF